MRRVICPPRLACAAATAMLIGGMSCGFATDVAAAPPTRIERAVQAMGTTLRLAVEAGDRASALAASERALRSLEGTEARLSTWREDSELAALNRAPLHEPVAVSPQLANDLSTARWCGEQTAGAFDPTIGALVEVWGLRVGGRQPSAAEIDRALASTGLENLELEGQQVRRRRDGLRIEEGGFGKGAGLAAAMAVLAEDAKVTSAWLNFGGQMAILGVPATDEPATGWPVVGRPGLGRAWRVEVADPRDRTRSILAIELAVPAPDMGPLPHDGAYPRRSGRAIGSFATSGNSERGVTVDGRRVGHLLDPRTGRPAADFGSLTVWTADPAIADCLSTGLYVLGPEVALAWAAAEPGIEALAVIASGGGLAARATPGFAGRIRALVEDLEIEILPPGFETKPRAGELPQHKASPLRPQTNSVGSSPRHS